MSVFLLRCFKVYEVSKNTDTVTDTVTVTVGYGYGYGMATVRLRYGNGTATVRLRVSARIERITVCFYVLKKVYSFLIQCTRCTRKRFSMYSFVYSVYSFVYSTRVLFYSFLYSKNLVTLIINA
jgi:hypothetical protein